MSLNDQDYIDLIALQDVPQMGPSVLKQLLAHCYTIRGIIEAKSSELNKIPHISETLVYNLKHNLSYCNAEEIFKQCQKHHIQLAAYTEPNFPFRLKRQHDAPILLYYKGEFDFNAGRVLAIVGTRKLTTYGKSEIDKLIPEIHPYQIQIISGLAYGTDIYTHKVATDAGIQNIGVLGNGLSSIYPSSHKNIALKMMKNGGLISELVPNAAPDAFNFPLRNRIIAGMCDALLVVESAEKGGSMISADLAFAYNKDVFAIPGRNSDLYSSGCNLLIKTNKAQIYTAFKDIVEHMNWEVKEVLNNHHQRQLFDDISESEKGILELFYGQSEWHYDLLYQKSEMSSSQLAGVLLNLEIKGYIKSGPGKKYIKV